MFGNASQYKQLEEPHRQVHQNGLEALQAYEQGDKAKAIEHLKAMEQASEQVMRILDTF